MVNNSRTVLCYGDSNTWGYNPQLKTRFPYEQRWTTILQRHLGKDYTVVAEGLCGRTTVLDDPYEGINKNGRRFLLTCMETHKPLAFMVLMLGTNDFKKRFNGTAWDAAQGVKILIEDIYKSELMQGPENHLVVVAPSRIGKLEGTDFEKMFEGAERRSGDLGSMLNNIASDMKCSFIDSSRYIEVSPYDAIHLDHNAHAILGKAIAEKIIMTET